jgi:hypothetical protein
MVEHYSCDQESPICLYDFTLKTIMSDYFVYSIKDIGYNDTIHDYFYSDFVL